MATTAVIDLSRFAKTEDVITRIKTNTTLYLSPTGSDTSGDGSSGSPWFSIKRAIEYLYDYSIDPNIHVTIRGLAGTYNYNNTHKAVLKHPDSDRISINFDYANGATTYNNGSNFSITSDGADGYRVSFGVDSASGFSAGQYIKITSDTYGLSCLYNGYFRLYAVNTGSNILTIEYNGYGPIRVPPQNTSSHDLHVQRMETHINSSCTSGSFLFIYDGLYTLRLFGANANTNSHNHDFVSIKYSHLQPSMLCANGFNKGLMLRGADMVFDTGHNGARITNCYDGVYAGKDSVLNTSSLWCSCNHRGVVYNGSIGGNFEHRFGAVNNNYVGLEVGYMSGYIATTIGIGSTTLIGNEVGAWTIDGSTSIFNGLYSSYNDTGLTSSSGANVILNFSAVHETIIEHNTGHAIIVSDANIDLSSSTIYNNHNGVYAYNTSTVSCRDYVALKDVDVTYNTYDGYYQNKGGVFNLNYFTARHNGKQGYTCVSCIGESLFCDSSFNSIGTISNNTTMHSGCIFNCYYCSYDSCHTGSGFNLGWGCTGNFFDTTFSNNNLHGMFIGGTASAHTTKTSCNNNQGDGIYLTNCSSLTVYGNLAYDTVSYVNNNGGYGINVVHNSNVSLRQDVWVTGNTGYNIICRHASTVSDTANTAVGNVNPPNNNSPMYHNEWGAEYNGAAIIRGA